MDKENGDSEEFESGNEDMETESDGDDMPHLHNTAMDAQPSPPVQLTPEEAKEQATAAKELGNKHYLAKEYRAAIRDYTQAIDLEPNEAAYYNNRAAAYMMLRAFDEAFDDTQKALQLDRTSIKYLLRAAKCCASLGRNSDAQRYYAEVLQADPTNETAFKEMSQLDSTASLRQMAERAMTDGQYNNAISLIDRALILSPSDTSLKLLQAEAYLRMNNLGPAERISAGILRDDSTHTEALYIRGLCMYNKGDPEKAQDHFKRALRGDPDHARTRVALKNTKALLEKKEAGNTAFKIGKNEEALTLYDEALQVDPSPVNAITNAKLQFNRSCVLTKLKRQKEAMEACDRAITLDPTYTKPILKRAKIHLDEERFDEAIADYEKAGEMDPSDMSIKQQLKDAKLEKKKAARVNYYKILEVPKDVNEVDLRKAYKKMALKFHPDRCQGEEAKKEAEIKFKLVGEAFAVLNDPKKRQRYDSGYDLEEINQGGGGGGHPGFDPNDMFAQMFGGRRGGGGHGAHGHGHGGFGGFGHHFGGDDDD